MLHEGTETGEDSPAKKGGGVGGRSQKRGGGNSALINKRPQGRAEGGRGKGLEVEMRGKDTQPCPAPECQGDERKQPLRGVYVEDSGSWGREGTWQQADRGRGNDRYEN